MKTFLPHYRNLMLTATLALVALPVTITAKDQPAKPSKPRIEVCFVLDTTGSMGGLIEGAKQKIWAIANDMIAAKPTPEIRFGLVGYRDRNDDYVTKMTDLNADIDAIYEQLQKFQAAGGGDTPESVNRALRESVTKMSWSTNREVLKIVFLVGDAPPHEYPDEPGFREICRDAVKRDLIINTVQCGRIAETTPVWQEIARLSEGEYVAIGQTGDMIVVATPMDKDLAELNAKLGRTYIAYGDEAVRDASARRLGVASAAPASVAAERAKFVTATGGSALGEGELVNALASGDVRYDSIKKENLPAELQRLSESELKSVVEERSKEREKVQARIIELSKKRDAYLQAEKKKLAATGKRDAFDDKVAEMVRSQAARKGIQYAR